MLVIRLSNIGRKGEHRFRVVVKEKRSKRDGKAIDVLGWYRRTEKGETKVINKERVNYWLSKGAKTSPTVDKILNL